MLIQCIKRTSSADRTAMSHTRACASRRNLVTEFKQNDGMESVMDPKSLFLWKCSFLLVF